MLQSFKLSNKYTSFLNSSKSTTKLASLLSPRLIHSKKNYLDKVRVMIYGSNTDVGKTIVSAGLSISALNFQRKVSYIKPLQFSDIDEYFIQFYTNPKATNDIFVRTLQCWDDIENQFIEQFSDEGPSNLSDFNDVPLLKLLKKEMNAFESSISYNKEGKSKKLFTIIETAGGVLSIGPDQILQADLYRPLRLPIILIGDGRPGGISSTITALESLRSRGYTIHAIVFIDQSNSRKFTNATVIESILNNIYQNVPGDSLSKSEWSIGKKPKVFSLTPTPKNKNTLLHSWFQENEKVFNDLFDHINLEILNEMDTYEDMIERGYKNIWWPFVQNSKISIDDVSFVDSAYKHHLKIYSPSDQIKNDKKNKSHTTHSKKPSLTSYQDFYDATSSLWTQMIGHGNQNISIGISEAAGRYGHLFFRKALHPPVVQLSRYLLEAGPGKHYDPNEESWAKKVFYSESGSSALEAGLKMAYRLYESRHNVDEDLSSLTKIGEEKTNYYVLTQKSSSHGYSLGMMDCSPNLLNIKQIPWYERKTTVINYPTISYQKSRLVINASDIPDSNIHECIENDLCDINSTMDLFDFDARLNSNLAEAYRIYIKNFLENEFKKDIKLFAILIEPVMISLGFRFIDPLFQKILIQEGKKLKIPIIFDEVTVGMYRLGPSSCCEILKEVPDIACYGKNLSGGYLPIATALASGETFDAFANDPSNDSLIHGHSYNGNPILCTSALESIRILENHIKHFSPSDYFNEISIHSTPHHPIHHHHENKTSRRNLWLPTFFTEDELKQLSRLPGVESVFALGTVLKIQLTTSPTKNVSRHKHPNMRSSYFNINHEEENDDEDDDDILKNMDTLAKVVVHLLKNEGIITRALGNNVFFMISPTLFSSGESISTSNNYGKPSSQVHYFGAPVSIATPPQSIQSNILNNQAKLKLFKTIKNCLSKAFYLKPNN